MYFDIDTARWKYQQPYFDEYKRAWGQYDHVSGLEAFNAIKCVLESSKTPTVPSGIETYWGRLSTGASYLNVENRTFKEYPRYVSTSGAIVDSDNKSFLIQNPIDEIKNKGPIFLLSQINKTNNLFCGTITISSGLGSISDLDYGNSFYGKSYTAYPCGSWKSLDSYNDGDYLKYVYTYNTSGGFLSQYLNNTLLEVSYPTTSGTFGRIFQFGSGTDIFMNSYAMPYLNNFSGTIPTFYTINGFVRNKPIKKCSCTYGVDTTNKTTCRKCFGNGYVGLSNGDLEYIKLDNPLNIFYEDSEDKLLSYELNKTFSSFGKYTGNGYLDIKPSNIPGVKSTIRAFDIVPYIRIETNRSHVDYETLKWAYDTIKNNEGNWELGVLNIDFNDAVGYNSYRFDDSPAKFNFSSNYEFPSGNGIDSLLGFKPISNKYFEPFANCFTKGYFCLFKQDGTHQEISIIDAVSSIKTSGIVKWDYLINDSANDCNWQVVGYKNFPLDASLDDYINLSTNIGSIYKPHMANWYWADAITASSGIKKHITFGDKSNPKEIYLSNDGTIHSVATASGVCYNPISFKVGTNSFDNICFASLPTSTFNFFAIKNNTLCLVDKNNLTTSVSSGIVAEINHPGIEDFCFIRPQNLDKKNQNSRIQTNKESYSVFNYQPNNIAISKIDNELFLSKLIIKDVYAIYNNSIIRSDIVLGPEFFYYESKNISYCLDSNNKEFSYYYYPHGITYGGDSIYSQYCYDISTNNPQSSSGTVVALTNKGLSYIDFDRNTITNKVFTSQAISAIKSASAGLGTYFPNISLYYDQNEEYLCLSTSSYGGSGTIIYKAIFDNNNISLSGVANPFSYNDIKTIESRFNNSFLLTLTDGIVVHVDAADYTSEISVIDSYSKILLSNNFAIDTGVTRIYKPNFYNEYYRYNSSPDTVSIRKTLQTQFPSLSIGSKIEYDIDSYDNCWLMPYSDFWQSHTLPYFGYLYYYLTDNNKIVARTKIEHNKISEIIIPEDFVVRDFIPSMPTISSFYGTISYFTDYTGTFVSDSVFKNKNNPNSPGNYVLLCSGYNELFYTGYYYDYYRNSASTNYNYHDVLNANIGLYPMLRLNGTNLFVENKLINDIIEISGNIYLNTYRTSDRFDLIGNEIWCNNTSSLPSGTSSSLKMYFAADSGILEINKTSNEYSVLFHEPANYNSYDKLICPREAAKIASKYPYNSIRRYEDGFYGVSGLAALFNNRKNIDFTNYNIFNCSDFYLSSYIAGRQDNTNAPALTSLPVLGPPSPSIATDWSQLLFILVSGTKVYPNWQMDANISIDRPIVGVDNNFIWCFENNTMLPYDWRTGTNISGLNYAINDEYGNIKALRAPVGIYPYVLNNFGLQDCGQIGNVYPHSYSKIDTVKRMSSQEKLGPTDQSFSVWEYCGKNIKSVRQFVYPSGLIRNCVHNLLPSDYHISNMDYAVSGCGNHYIMYTSTIDSSGIFVVVDLKTQNSYIKQVDNIGNAYDGVTFNDFVVRPPGVEWKSYNYSGIFNDKVDLKNHFHNDGMFAVPYCGLSGYFELIQYAQSGTSLYGPYLNSGTRFYANSNFYFNAGAIVFDTNTNTFIEPKTTKKARDFIVSYFEGGVTSHIGNGFEIFYGFDSDVFNPISKYIECSINAISAHKEIANIKYNFKQNKINAGQVLGTIGYNDGYAKGRQAGAYPDGSDMNYTMGYIGYLNFNNTIVHEEEIDVRRYDIINSVGDIEFMRTFSYNSSLGKTISVNGVNYQLYNHIHPFDYIEDTLDGIAKSGINPFGRADNTRLQKYEIVSASGSDISFYIDDFNLTYTSISYFGFAQSIDVIPKLSINTSSSFIKDGSNLVLTPNWNVYPWVWNNAPGVL